MRTLEEIALDVLCRAGRDFGIDVDETDPLATGHYADAHDAILAALREAWDAALDAAAGLAEEPVDWLPAPYQTRLARAIRKLVPPESSPNATPAQETTMSKKPNFPKEILVTVEGEPDDSYLITHESAESLNAEEHADQEVAIYVLKEIRRFVVTRDLVK